MDVAAMVTQLDPTTDAVPLVCDSPHSGTDYPADFGYAVPLARLRRGEDTHVDTLWGAAPDVGATLIKAHFPRTYVDVNRRADDLDAAMLAGDWPVPLAPSEKTRLGSGLVWTRLDARTPLYDRRLSVAEVEQRLARCYRPYHAALSQAIEQAYVRFGGVWHLNLHSMPSNAYERLELPATRPLADFVLGNRDGQTCSEGYIALVESALLRRGYTVARNDPYKGVQLIADIGRPAEQRHSLQVEIKRPLYMDEDTRQPNAGYERVRRDLTGVLHELADYVRMCLSVART